MATYTSLEMNGSGSLGGALTGTQVFTITNPLNYLNNYQTGYLTLEGNSTANQNLSITTYLTGTFSDFNGVDDGGLVYNNEATHWSISIAGSGGTFMFTPTSDIAEDSYYIKSTGMFSLEVVSDSVPFEYEFIPRGNQAPYFHVIGTNSSYTYDYDVLVSTGETFSNQTGDVTIYFTDNNPRTLAISGVFPNYKMSQINGNYASFSGPVIWGDQQWESMEETFFLANNMSTFASDTPDLSLVTSFYKFFQQANISVANNLGDWDVSNVTNMYVCFAFANLTNIDVTNWNVSNVTSFRYMFSKSVGLGSTSPTDLTGWDVSSGDIFEQMFRNNTSFNQDISSWDMGSATGLQAMFLDATSFNQPIGNWNTANVTSIRTMLNNVSAFDQDLSNWNILNITDGIDFLKGTGLSTANYDSTLISWAAQNPTNNITIDFGSSQYTPGGAAETARTSLINSGWTIIDGGAAPVPFTLRIDTTLGNGFDSFVLPMVSGTYDVDWGDGNIDLAQSGTKTHNYLTSGIYDVAVTGGVTLQFNFGGDCLKVTNLLKWGENQWTSASGMLAGCQNMVITATDIPDWSSCTTFFRMLRRTTITNVPNINQWDVSNVSNIGDLFYETVFDASISSWDVSNVGNMNSVFRGTPYNQPMGSWDVSSVTDMRLLFNGASSFNQDISGWDVSNVTNMNNMFYEAETFNQPIGDWDVSNVLYMNYMFSFTSSFNQPIGSWDVSSVIGMVRMFDDNQSFNQPIGGWNVSSVTDMVGMFYGTTFNQPIGDWDVSSVDNMIEMFAGASAFNQPIGDWDVSSVLYMREMFAGASAFNQPLGNWNLSNVSNMFKLFKTAISYNQDLSSWNVDNVTFCDDFSIGASSWTLPKPNFPNCTP